MMDYDVILAEVLALLAGGASEAHVASQPLCPWRGALGQVMRCIARVSVV